MTMEVAAPKALATPPARTAGEPTEHAPLMENLSPAQIVAELDKYVVGQQDAKRAVAVALRNRYRRQMLPEDLRQEVTPRNILMMGPTGVGKTEIARRVARIVEAPFVKVEATKFTEVGYVGRDVESIVRDLVEVAIDLLHGKRMEAVKDEASRIAVDRLAELLVEQVRFQGEPRTRRRRATSDLDDGAESRAEIARQKRFEREKAEVLQLLAEQALEDETVEIEIEPEPLYDDGGDVDDGPPPDEMSNAFDDFIDRYMARRTYRRRVSVREARRILTQQESERLVDFDAVIDEAINRVEEAGVVFIDEIDKTISRDAENGGGTVSSEGVQRDLLPIVEGSVVMTRYGPVRTDHVLFIAAGSFHNTRPSDLIPELQGRFPIRVELGSLSEDDLYAVLTQPRSALTRQYQALLATEGVELVFAEDALREIARLATLVNSVTDDIGARRLLTIVEKVVEQISFDASSYAGQQVVIDAALVRERVGDVQTTEDLTDFIL
jgi:ATP-dependent HslUV protease ATP-binding subunit HslU